MGRILRTGSFEDRGKIRIDISTRFRKVVFAIAVSMIAYAGVILVLGNLG